MLSEQPDHRHQEAWRAEAALQAVAFVKCLLHRMQRGAGLGQSLDCRDLVALGLNGEHQARAHWRTVKQDSAAPANAVLAADVRTRQAKFVAEVVRQQQAWIAWRRVDDAVDLQAAKAFSVMTRTR